MLRLTTMRLFFLIILLSISISSAFPQKSKGHKFVPYFWALETATLAYRLTDHLSTDSAKVYAIHSWIAHNIKYDVKKYLAFDNTRLPAKKILRKRKATSIGYSELFNQLCKSANIKSVTIPGYIKNKNIDWKDKFYVDEHEWNAVYVDNQWKLIDVSWDAGYFKYSKRTLWGYAIHIVTLGHADRKKYKPHFISSPHNTYLYRTGYFFKTDHIPADPLWQLTKPERTVEQAETDSSYYLGIYDESYSLFNDDRQDDRMRIVYLRPEPRIISDGFRCYYYNHKNQFSIGKSYEQLATIDFKTLNLKTTDTVGLLRQVDTIEFVLNQAIMHYDSNSYFLSVQKAEQLKNSEKKKNILATENQRLIMSTKVAANNLAAGKKLCAVGKRVPKRILKGSRTQLKRIQDDKKFYESKYSPKSNYADSAASAQKVGSLLDSIKKTENKITRKFKELDSLYIFCYKRIGAYSLCSKFNKSIAEILYTARISYEDDLDYNIRKEKDDLMEEKFDDDSLLIDRYKGFIVAIFYDRLLELKKAFDDLYMYHQAVSDEYIKLKKACLTGNDFSKPYENNKKLYEKELKEYTELTENSMLRKKFKRVQKLCKKQVKRTRKEQAAYVNEKEIETQMFAVRSSYTTRHFKALKASNKKQLSNCKKIKTGTNKIKNKYKKR